MSSDSKTDKTDIPVTIERILKEIKQDASIVSRYNRIYHRHNR